MGMKDNKGKSGKISGENESVARPFNSMTGFLTMESLMQMGGVSL